MANALLKPFYTFHAIAFFLLFIINNAVLFYIGEKTGLIGMSQLSLQLLNWAELNLVKSS